MVVSRGPAVPAAHAGRAHGVRLPAPAPTPKMIRAAGGPAARIASTIRARWSGTIFWASCGAGRARSTSRGSSPAGRLTQKRPREQTRVAYIRVANTSAGAWRTLTSGGGWIARCRLPPGPAARRPITPHDWPARGRDRETSPRSGARPRGAGRRAGALGRAAQHACTGPTASAGRSPATPRRMRRRH